jgi:DNA invertase Pin-like site-specific DNA recombinase
LQRHIFRRGRAYRSTEPRDSQDCFEDQDISGAALGNRPGVLRLQEAALARHIDAVLVTDLSRLSRSNGDLSKMIDRLVAKSIRIVGVQDGYDSGRRGHKLQAGLSGIIREASAR